MISCGRPQMCFVSRLSFLYIADSQPANQQVTRNGLISLNLQYSYAASTHGKEWKGIGKTGRQALNDQQLSHVGTCFQLLNLAPDVPKQPARLAGLSFTFKKNIASYAARLDAITNLIPYQLAS